MMLNMGTEYPCNQTQNKEMYYLRQEWRLETKIKKACREVTQLSELLKDVTMKGIPRMSKPEALETAKKKSHSLCCQS